MANTPKLFRDIADFITGYIAHPLRGVLTEVPPDFLTNPAPLVTVRVTPSGASYSRDMRNVPWNVSSDPAQSRRPPAIGDYVALVFKGGSSEFPVVTAYYPGPGTSDAAIAAQSPRAGVPTGALVANAKTPGGQAILDFLQSGKAQAIIDREGRAACAEFASNVLAGAGIKFPHTNSAVDFPKVLEGLGLTPHPFSQALPGDVICWEGVPGYGANGSGGHIAIYEGNYRIAESNHGVINVDKQIAPLGWHLDQAQCFTIP